MNSKKLITVILLLLLLLAIPIQAFAVGAATAEIPFTVKNAPGAVVIEAVDEAPLPEQTVFESVLAGKFVLSFADPGDYYYKVCQKPGGESKVSYDSTVYAVCVSVFVEENGGLYSVVTVDADGSSQKIESIGFQNVLDETLSSDMPGTGDNSHLELWITLMTGSFLGMTVCLLLLRKEKPKRQG